jgi:hypothetical protein
MRPSDFPARLSDLLSRRYDTTCRAPWRSASCVRPQHSVSKQEPARTAYPGCTGFSNAWLILLTKSHLAVPGRALQIVKTRSPYQMIFFHCTGGPSRIKPDGATNCHAVAATIIRPYSSIWGLHKTGGGAQPRQGGEISGVRCSVARVDCSSERTPSNPEARMGGLELREPWKTRKVIACRILASISRRRGSSQATGYIASGRFSGTALVFAAQLRSGRKRSSSEPKRSLRYV